jgi:hypothetical protein
MFCLSHAIVCLCALGCAVTVYAQPPAPSDDPPATFLDRIIARAKQPPDQGGGIHLSKHIAVVFGGVKQGSGVALGPAFSHTFEDGGYAQLKAEYSVRKFRLLQARYDSRAFWSGRGRIIGKLRWQDAPKLSLYRLGPDAPDLRVDYGERKTEASAQITIRAAPTLRLTTGLGLERYATSGGRIDLKEDESLSAIPPAAGLGTHPWFSHAFIAAAFDTRPSPGYSRTGRLLEMSFHDYRDWYDGQDSFGRVEGTAQQLLPTYGGRGVVDLSARTWLSVSNADRTVPFFLMPTLGGGDFLRGYSSYRFRDRHALLLRGEYRWAVHDMVDVAGLYEAGEVAPTFKGFDATQIEQSIAAGIRVHTKTSSLLRLDVARGRDGVKLSIGVTTGS